MKLAFFDVDGVLSAPRYLDESGAFVIGFSVDGWLAYCRNAGDRGYAYCLPVPGVEEFARGLAAEGCRLFVLSTLMSAPEEGAKRKFVEEQYPDLFDDMIFVNRDSEKLTVIKERAEAAGCLLSECVLVEDTFSTLLKAHEQGIRAIHISNLIAGNSSG